MITCRFLSLLASFRIERPERMPGWLRRHVERCDSCRRSFQAEREIARRLPAASTSTNQALPPFLKQRILARVRTDQSTSNASLRFAFRSAASVAAIAACALLLLLLMPRAGHEVVTWSSEDEPSPATSTAFPWSTTTAMDRVAGADLLRWGQTVHEPLEMEWARAVEDGHRLLAVVVQSCLPEPTADVLLSRTRQWVPTPATRNAID
jgi:hypothetical protein